MFNTTVAAPKVFGAGLIALDLVMSANARAPVRSYAGGTCGNVLAILSFHGWEAYPIARLGEDAASQRVRSDLAQWGVRLEHAACQPTADAPIIVQEIRRGRDGKPTHRFSCACPNCGKWLPVFKPVTRAAIESVSRNLPGTTVFFMDRLSRATLTLAAQSAIEGAIVMFEPSGKADERLVSEALNIAHIVKYADSRLASLDGLMGPEATPQLEVQTLGAEGLRYRRWLNGERSQWRQLRALPAPRLTDSCGSGDWCTAGLLSKLATKGLDGLASADVEQIEAALRHGQALAAWNCGFEGARGGMYACSRAAFNQQIAALMEGDLYLTMSEEFPDAIDEAPACPACGPAIAAQGAAAF